MADISRRARELGTENAFVVLAEVNKLIRQRKAAVARMTAVKPALRRSGLNDRLRRIQLVLCDVDGVLTDGGVWMGRDGETKRFNIRDGLGMKILQRSGIQVGWVSRRPSNATRQRAEDLSWNPDRDHVAEGRA